MAVKRTTQVAGVDHNMFTDMRPSERQDARDALAEKAKQYELAPEDDYNGDPIYGCLEDEELAPWVLAKFAARGPRWRQRKKDEFDTLEEANRAAKDIVEHILSTRIPRVFSSFTHVADGDRDIKEYDIEPELYGVEPKPARITWTSTRRSHRTRRRSSLRPQMMACRPTRPTTLCTATRTAPTCTTS